MFVVPDEQSSRKILVGRDILVTPRAKAIVDATRLKLETGNTADGSMVRLAVSLVKKDRRGRTGRDTQCPRVDDPKIIGELVLLLDLYRTAIALNMRELGETKGTKVKIMLIDNEPVSYRPRRLSYEELKTVKETLGELEENGIFRESHLLYASPIL